ncbi:DNA methyltransferase [Salmonella enterica]|nr:DNA methyltransferase [Salmonella enterica]
MKANDYVLTPGRYVGAAEQEDDGVAFETKMRELSKTLFAQMNRRKNWIKQFARTWRRWVMGSNYIEMRLEDCMDAIIDYRGKPQKKLIMAFP